MTIDNQLWRARVGIYNDNQLHQFTSLKTKLPILYIITVCLILDIFLSLTVFDTGT